MLFNLKSLKWYGSWLSEHLLPSTCALRSAREVVLWMLPEYCITPGFLLARAGGLRPLLATRKAVAGTIGSRWTKAM